MKRKILLKKEKIILSGKRRKYYRTLNYLQAFFPLNENILLGLSLFYKYFLLKNFFIFNHFLKWLKINYRLYLFRNYIKNIQNMMFLVPLFLYKKQYFAKHIDIFNSLTQNNIFGFFIFKNFFKLNPNYFNKFRLFNYYPGNNFILTNFDEQSFKNLNLLNERDSKKLYFFIKNKYENKNYAQTINLINLFFNLNLDLRKIFNLLIFNLYFK